MAKGKYGVKSAQNRADNAGLRAEQLKAKQDAEREAHRVEVAALKATVERLSAQLTGAVADLAADQVRRVEAECADQIRAERDRQRQAALEVFRHIGRATVFYPPGNMWHISADGVKDLVGDLARVLGIPAGEAQDAGAETAGLATDRAARRADQKRYKAAASGTPYTVVRGVR